MGRRRRLTPKDYQRRVAALRKLHDGQRTLVFIGDLETSHEANPRAFFLDAINTHAPQVHESLRTDVLTAFAQALRGEQVLSLHWHDLRHNRYEQLRTTILTWASRWGLEPERWDQEPTWILDAALRLLLKWHEGQATKDLTLVYDTYTPVEKKVREALELRSIAGFALLVFAHVLELRPWLSRAPQADATPETEPWVGGRSAQDIAKAVRRAARTIGLKSVRKALPGPK